MTNKMQLCRIIYCSLTAVPFFERYIRTSSGASKLYVQLLVLFSSVVAGWYRGCIGTDGVVSCWSFS